IATPGEQALLWLQLLDHIDISGSDAIFLRQLCCRNAFGALGENVLPHLCGIFGRPATAPGHPIVIRVSFMLRSFKYFLRNHDDAVETANLRF
ncbi:hypothetical protein, partial [Aestuariivirga sp.]|uniref:hypothetical protein n=1 Tax=Aestuariivirga sp. TaxID=2650926 RepID=UPI0037833B28